MLDFIQGIIAQLGHRVVCGATIAILVGASWLALKMQWQSARRFIASTEDATRLMQQTGKDRASSQQVLQAIEKVSTSDARSPGETVITIACMVVLFICAAFGVLHLVSHFALPVTSAARTAGAMRSALFNGIATPLVAGVMIWCVRRP